MPLAAPTFRKNLFSQSTFVVSTTELGISTGTSTIGTNAIPGDFYVIVDAVANMVAGDQMEIAMYEAARSGGTQRRIVLATMSGVQAAPFLAGPFALGNSWEFTLKLIAGSARAVDASIHWRP